MTNDISIIEINQTSSLISPYLLPTPFLQNDWLSDVVNKPSSLPLSKKEIWVKWENLQLTGSFKPRGALSKILRLKKRGIDKVLAVSAGNHGIGVAYASKKLSMQASIVVPKNAARTKMKAISGFGAELIIYGDSYDEAELFARKLAKERQVEFVSPYNDEDVVMGQGTIAIEMLKQQALDLIIAPVGGGGLLSGLAIAATYFNPEKPIDVIGVQPKNSTAMQSSFRAGEIVVVEESPTYADGLSGNLEENTCTFSLVKKYVKDIVTVTEKEIEQTIYNFLYYDHMVVEGSAAVAAAGLLANAIDLDKYKNIGVVVTGRNIDIPRLSKIIETYSV
ncbi:MAG: pyridoxal-phosphate dependent enzyme [Acidobacteria bacterium]|nr:pyridoxal-phosphate dependent enzyme [Acidobacteriota bacterium]